MSRADILFSPIKLNSLLFRRVRKIAKRMGRIILSSVICLALPYFSTLSHKRHNFRGGGGRRGVEVVEYKTRVLIFSANSA
jgi:hypothetical protein